VALPYQPIERTAAQSRKSGTLAVSDKELRNSPGAGKFEKGLRWIIALKNLNVGANSVCDRQPRVKGGLICKRNIRLPDVCHNEFPMEPLGYDLGALHHLLHVRARSDTYQNPFVRTELLFDAMALQILIELMIDDIRGYDQRKFA
jgi:hypothetical protein